MNVDAMTESDKRPCDFPEAQKPPEMWLLWDGSKFSQFWYESESQALRLRVGKFTNPVRVR